MMCAGGIGVALALTGSVVAGAAEAGANATVEVEVELDELGLPLLGNANAELAIHVEALAAEYGDVYAGREFDLETATATVRYDVNAEQSRVEEFLAEVQAIPVTDGLIVEVSGAAVPLAVLQEAALDLSLNPDKWMAEIGGRVGSTEIDDRSGTIWIGLDRIDPALANTEIALGKYRESGITFMIAPGVASVDFQGGPTRT